MSFSWKKHFGHPGEIGRIRRRIRSLHVKASTYRRIGKMHLVADKERQIKALRLHLQLLEMEEKKKWILKELEAMGPIPAIEPYIKNANNL